MAEPKTKIVPGAIRAARVIKFIEKYILVPEGSLVGKPMVLLPEQKDFINAVYDNVDPVTGLLYTRRGILSIARKNGKSGLISAILAAHLIGPEAKQNSMLYSAARSRDQAGVVFNYLAKSLRLDKKLDGLVQITDSYKTVKGLAINSLYRALSADAQTAHGLSPALTIHDELGQVIGPQDALYDALETAGGAQLEPLSLIISTQAANDADLLSVLIDDALRNPTPETVLRLYAAGKEDDAWDPEVWKRVNFALGIFRSEKEFVEAAKRAKRIPTFEATFRNLYLNQRISLLNLLIPPSIWRHAGEAKLDEELFYSGEEVHIGLDLSASQDLTAAVAAVRHPTTGAVHLKVWVFTPLFGLEERAKTDKAPYQTFVEQGKLIALPTKTISYDMVADYLKEQCEGMNLAGIHFDRWRMDYFRKSAERAGFGGDAGTQWKPVGQGFRDFSPRVEYFQTLLINEQLVHGNHPLLNMAASNAIGVTDPAGNVKADKSMSSARIDPLVAAIMAVGGFAPFEESKPEVSESSLFFV